MRTVQLTIVEPGFHIVVSDGDVSQSYRQRAVFSRPFDHSEQTIMVAVHTLILMKMIYAILALRRIRLRRKKQKRRHKMWVGS